MACSSPGNLPLLRCALLQLHRGHAASICRFAGCTLLKLLRCRLPQMRGSCQSLGKQASGLNELKGSVLQLA